MNKKVLAFILAILISQSAPSHANDGRDEVIDIYADMCEKINPEDTISQARARASDKAVFLSVEKLPVLELPRKEFDQYDFNVLVYKLVDNYVEDLNIKTTSQKEDKICVEIKGIITGSNIINSVIETKKNADERAKTRNDNNLEGSSSLQTAKAIENIIMQEADISSIEDTFVQHSIEENPIDIDYNVVDFERISGVNIDTDKIFEEMNLETSTPEIIIEDSETIIIVNSEDEDEVDSSKSVEDDETTNKASVYIAPTKLFNDSTSNEHSDILKKKFTNNDYFNLTDNKDKADYIIMPNILRVKVDAINNITNRMQMVVMVELEDIKNKSFGKEYQNRFTLLSADDNEQKIAQDLMIKLLEKAGSQILTKIELSERKSKNIKTLPKIITPSNLAQ